MIPSMAVTKENIPENLDRRKFFQLLGSKGLQRTAAGVLLTEVAVGVPSTLSDFSSDLIKGDNESAAEKYLLAGIYDMGIGSALSLLTQTSDLKLSPKITRFFPPISRRKLAQGIGILLTGRLALLAANSYSKTHKNSISSESHGSTDTK